MMREGGNEPLEGAGIVLAASIPLMVHANYLGVFRVTITVAVMIFLVLAASVIWARGTSRKPLVTLALTAVGIVYPALVTYMYPLRYHDYAVGALAGTVLLMFPIVLTWATDTGAYAFGRMFGKHKLIPSVSPGKTIEGAVGGIVTAIAAAWLYVHFLLTPFAHLTMLTASVIGFAIIIAVVAQVGDLVESLFKRDAGVKDSLQPASRSRWDSGQIRQPAVRAAGSVRHHRSPASRGSRMTRSRRCDPRLDRVDRDDRAARALETEGALRSHGTHGSQQRGAARSSGG